MWAAPSISIFEDLRAALTQFAEIAKAMAVVTAHIIAPAEACDQRGLIFCLRSALTLHHKRLTIGIGSVYRSQTHKVLQRRCRLMSVVCMQTSNLESRYQECCLINPVAERISIGRVALGS